MVDVTTGLTVEEEQQVIKLLGKVKSPISYPFFCAVAAITVSSAIETVILRTKNSHVQILLLERDAKDTVYAGLLHSPGTVLRPTDQSYSDAFERLQIEELKTRFITEPIFVCTWFHHEKRGAGNAMVFLCQIDGDPKVGQFYDVDGLPPNIVETQKQYINTVVDHYKRNGFSYE